MKPNVRGRWFGDSVFRFRGVKLDKHWTVLALPLPNSFSSRAQEVVWSKCLAFVGREWNPNETQATGKSIVECLKRVGVSILALRSCGAV